MEKSAEAFRTISEVAEDLDLPQHVLRFWETRFVQIKPLKRAGGRRFYRPDDVELLRAIRQLLYGEGYTIKGVQKILKEQGVRALISASLAGAAAGDPQSRMAPPPLPQVAEMQRPDAYEPSGDYELQRATPGSYAAALEAYHPERDGQPLSADAAPMAYRPLMDADAAGTMEKLLAELQECQRILEVARR
jgi:DNA-binding transcriptional MerR regulator